MTLIPIGQFSKMTRLSIKALRIYAKAGLLRPASVDSSTGYRYYELGQANRAEAIRILRSLDVPISEIMLMLDTDNTTAVDERLDAHRQRLANQIAAQEHMLSYLESLIHRKGGIMPYEVVRTKTDSQLVAATRFHTIMAWLSDHDLEPVGPPRETYLNDPQTTKPEDLQTLVEFPISEDA